MWNYPGFGSTTTMENAVEYLVGEEKKNEFFDQYRSNYITKEEIAFLSDNGFNALRVPLHYKHFSPSFNQFSTKGFELLEPLINACRENDVYLILDMHAAPGAQNTSDFSDSDGFKSHARRTAILGCEGKWAIHPSQVDLANEVFTLPENEVKKAKDILEAMKKAQESGAGAATLNGKLIDAASVRQAEQIIKQTKLIETMS